MRGVAFRIIGRNVGERERESEIDGGMILSRQIDRQIPGLSVDEEFRPAGRSQRGMEGKKRKKKRGQTSEKKRETRQIIRRKAERGGADCLWPDLGWCWAGGVLGCFFWCHDKIHLQTGREIHTVQSILCTDTY